MVIMIKSETSHEDPKSIFYVGNLIKDMQTGDIVLVCHNNGAIFGGIVLKTNGFSEYITGLPSNEKKYSQYLGRVTLESKR